MTRTRALRRSARVLLFDDQGRLLLIRRTRPTGETYLTTPGGGVGPDETWEVAAARECAEELGAEVLIGSVAWAGRLDLPDQDSEQRFFTARLVGLDDQRRTGPELSEPWRGTYETLRVSLDDPALDEFRPAELVPMLRERGGQLAREAATLVG
jgi:8-oxo-dGTP pyrophosphatase MutT (NUDIX family)